MREARSFFLKRNSEDGSTLPFILILVFVTMLFVAGLIAASSSFLTLKQLQAQCDGAALAAGGAGGGLEEGAAASEKAAQEEVDTYRDRAYEGSSHPPQMNVQSRGDQIIVVCNQKKPVPFGTLFGYKDGVKHNVTSTVYLGDR